MDWYPAEPRFEVVYHLHSMERRAERLRLNAGCAATIRRSIRSPGVAGANWYEREIFDLFGVRFRITRPGADHDARRLGRPPAAQGLPRSRVAIAIRRIATMSDPDLNPRRNVEASPAEIAKDGRHRRRMTLNMGPQHPSTHGVLRCCWSSTARPSSAAYPDIGFLHTGIEKQFEVKKYQQAVTADRPRRLPGAALNNLCYALRSKNCSRAGDPAAGADGCASC